ncbi:restriction endonuclease subunit S [Sorangium sp. So ce1036]|uniref:restriction endonuclease subunit S n=1 Tax=Sorangium sp. So ce1036 TaxID=3133328 RepID=UPI003F041864
MSDELPKGWMVVRLGDLADDVRNGISTKPADDGTHPILRISAVRPMRLDIADTRFLGGSSEQWASYSVHKDDLLFTRYNGNPQLVGACALVREEPEWPLFYPDKLIRVRVRRAIVEPSFIEKVVSVGISRAAIEAKTKTSAGQVGIAGGDLKDVPLLLPPVAEQRRIVSKIEALTTKSRRAKEALDAIPALLARFRKAVLAAAFRGDLTADWREKNPDVEPAEELLKRIRAERRRRWEEAELAKMRAKGKVPGDDRWKEKYEEPAPVDASELPELPEGWEWAPLGELAWDTGYGTSEKCDYSGIGAPVLRIPNIAKGKLDLADLKRALRRGDLNPDDAIHPGDLLIVRTNGSKDLIGRAALVHERLPEPHYFASYLIRFRLLPFNQLPAWIAMIWSSPHIRDFIEGMAATSAGQYNVSLGSLNRLPLPVPPMEEQDEIIRNLTRSMVVVERLETLMGNIREQVGTVDRSILAKAFRGELVPQDPNDEPASVLLERLRAERAQNGKPTNGAGRRRAAASPPPAPSDPAGRTAEPQASRRGQAPARSRG